MILSFWPGRSRSACRAKLFPDSGPVRVIVELSGADLNSCQRLHRLQVILIYPLVSYQAALFSPVTVFAMSEAAVSGEVLTIPDLHNLVSYLAPRIVFIPTLPESAPPNESGQP